MASILSGISGVLLMIILFGFEPTKTEALLIFIYGLLMYIVGICAAKEDN